MRTNVRYPLPCGCVASRENHMIIQPCAAHTGDDARRGDGRRRYRPGMMMLSLLVPRAVAEKFVALAKRDRLDSSDVMRRALAWYLENLNRGERIEK